MAHTIARDVLVRFEQVGRVHNRFLKCPTPALAQVGDKTPNFMLATGMWMERCLFSLLRMIAGALIGELEDNRGIPTE